MNLRDSEAWASGRPIFNRLPGFLGRYSLNPIVDWLTIEFDEFLVDIKQSIDDAESYIQVDNTPVSWLDFLAGLSGFTNEYWSETYSDATKRALIRRANWIHSNKGSADVLSYVLEAFGIQNVIINDSAFIVGVSLVGDIIQSGAYRFIIYINPNQDNIEVLRRNIPNLVLLYAPLWTEYRVIEDFSKFTSQLSFYAGEDLSFYGGNDGINNYLMESRDRAQRGTVALALDPITEIYKDALGALGFTRTDDYWQSLDLDLVRSINERGYDAVTKFLGLMVGDNESQKTTLLYGNQADSSSMVSSDNTTIGANWGSTSYLKWNNATTGVDTITLQILDVPMTDGNSYTLFSTDDSDAIISISGDVLTITINEPSAAPLTYNITLTGSTFSATLTYYFNDTGDTLDLDINGYTVGQITLTSKSVNDLVIGNNQAFNTGIIGNLTYFLVTSSITKNNLDQYKQLIVNQLNRIGYGLTLSVTEYHPDIYAYADRVSALGGTVSVASIDTLSDLVNDIVSLGVYEKLRYFYPFISEDILGANVALKGSDATLSGFASGNQQIDRGIIIDNDTQYIELPDSISASILASSDRCYITKIVLDTSDQEYLFGTLQASLGYGIRIVVAEGFSVNYRLFVNSTQHVASHRIQTDSETKPVFVIATDTDNNFRYHVNDTIYTGTYPNNTLQSSNIRIGEVLNDNANKNRFDMHYWAAFDQLTDAQINSLKSILSNFNAAIGR